MVRKKIKAKDARSWQGLAGIFLFLAIDELCSLHEILIPVLRGAMNTKGLLYFPWVIPAFFLLIIFLIVFRKFILALPNKTKTQFILAGTVYVLGALGMELIGGYIADKYGYTTIFGLASTIEELLEMSGVVIFINALLNYLQAQTSELNFSLTFQSLRKKN
jgi:cytochrome b subunit of formate dehydrogenase